LGRILQQDLELGIPSRQAELDLPQADDVRINDIGPVMRAAGNGIELVPMTFSFPPGRQGGAPVFNFRSEGRHFAKSNLLVGIFNGMGQAFMQMQFEFAAQPSVQRSLRAFLTRFDVIFTLNQDTLMEQKYLPTLMDQRWARAAVPGMKFINPGAFQGSVLDRIAAMEPNPGEFKFHPAIQPYVKLHGSATSKALLVDASL
jgi:hypothetical protein